MASSSAARIQDQKNQLRASVVPILGHPTINGLVICDADGNPISGGGGPQLRQTDSAVIFPNPDGTPVAMGNYQDGNYTLFDNKGQQRAYNEATTFNIVQASTIHGTKRDFDMGGWRMAPEGDDVCQANFIVPRDIKPETFPRIEVHYIKPDGTAPTPNINAVAYYAQLCYELSGDETRLREYCREVLLPVNNIHSMMTYEVGTPLVPLEWYQVRINRIQEEGKAIYIVAVEMYYEKDTLGSFTEYSKYG